MPIRPICSKVCFPSEAEALAEAKRMRKKNRKKYQCRRAYQCPKCGHYHLTSQK